MSETSDGAASNVVALPARRSNESSECFDTLRAYWTGLCAGRIMPDRTDVDPRGLSGALDKIFLVERIARGQARFRVAGQHLVDATGWELKGMPMTCLFTPAARVLINDSLQSVFDEPATIDLTLRGPRTGLLGRVAGRMTLLPLRGPDGEVTRAIGCFSSTPTQGRAPHVFDIVEEERKTLVGYGRPRRPDDIDPAFADAETARDRIRHRENMRQTLRVVTSE